MTQKNSSKQRLLVQLPTGSPAACMEAAKKVIGGEITANQTTLAKIGKDKSLQPWQRIAAIYALGFLGEPRVAKTLGDIVADPTEELAVRSHAAEALGNLGNRKMAGLLRDILKQRPPKELRESCKYALQELAT